MEEMINTAATQSPNREYKDGMFRALFKDPPKFLEVCNYLMGADFGPDTPMEEVTLSSALYLIRKNDVAFLIDNRLIVFTEHQSTLSPNIALRLLIYAADTYKMRFSAKRIHGSRQISLPRPCFFVFYNGTQKVLPVQTVRLSDMFAKWPCPENPPFSLDLELTVYDINTRNAPGILRSCKTLAQYEAFVELVREYQKKTRNLDRAAQLAIKDCIEQNILADFLTIHAKEIVDMLKTEITMEEFLEMEREYAIEDGMEIERRKNAATMKAEGMNTDTIARITGLAVDDILRL